jgi:hypothetical protein
MELLIPLPAFMTTNFLREVYPARDEDAGLYLFAQPKMKN